MYSSALTFAATAHHPAHTAVAHRRAAPSYQLIVNCVTPTNNYPRLEIREGEHVFVWLARFRDVAAYEEHCAALSRSPRWMGEIATALAGLMAGTPEVRRLVPTARSRMRE